MKKIDEIIFSEVSLPSPAGKLLEFLCESTEKIALSGVKFTPIELKNGEKKISFGGIKAEAPERVLVYPPEEIKEISSMSTCVLFESDFREWVKEDIRSHEEAKRNCLTQAGEIEKEIGELKRILQSKK